MVKDTESAPVRDEGYLIHGGGYTATNTYSPLGNNQYRDNTRGCIRITNNDMIRLVNFIFIPWKKPIALEVRE